MVSRRRFCSVGLAAVALGRLTFTAQAQAQAGIDIPFVPTPHVVIDEMLRLAGVTAQDFVMDLGSGDGRVLIAAATHFGARGIGVELDGELVEQSEAAAAEAGVASRVRFFQQDLFKTDLRPATVITMYLLPSVMMRLRPAFLALKPGTRLVSHDFRLGEWEPDETTLIRKNVFLWIVPARVAGAWQSTAILPEGISRFLFEFRQKYQVVDGLARMDGRHAQMWEAHLRGDRLRFVLVDDRDRGNEAALHFEGHIHGDVIEGRITRGVGGRRTVHPWRAERTRKPA